MAHVLRLFDGRQPVEDLLLEKTGTVVGIDGEVAHAERRQVLEEVGALRRIDVIVLQSRLDDDTGCRDVGPLDRHAQPRVAGAPTARTDEDVGAAFVKEALIDLLNMPGDGGVVGCREVVARLDIDDVGDVLRDAVTQRVCRTQQALLVGNRLEVFLCL